MKVVEYSGQAAPRACGICVLGDIQNTSGHGPEKPVLDDPALSRDKNRCYPEVPSYLSCAVIV